MTFETSMYFDEFLPRVLKMSLHC